MAKKSATNTPVLAEAPVSKASIARGIFNEMYGSAARKDVIARFVAEAKLTEKGAATYYQNFKRKLSEQESAAPTA